MQFARASLNSLLIVVSNYRCSTVFFDFMNALTNHCGWLLSFWFFFRILECNSLSLFYLLLMLDD